MWRESAWDAHSALREWLAQLDDEGAPEAASSRMGGAEPGAGELEWLEDELYDELIEAMEGEAWGRRGRGRTDH